MANLASDIKPAKTTGSSFDCAALATSAAETDAGVCAPNDRAFKANLSKLTLELSKAVLTGFIPDQEREGERDVPSH